MQPLTDSYLNVRTLPFDDELAKNTPDQELRWSFIYDHILRVYDIINPVMARQGIDKPLDDRQRMINLVAGIKRVIAESTFESARHMPVTRDMSAGRRLLLQRWCELVLDGEAPDDAAELARAVAALTITHLPNVDVLDAERERLVTHILGATKDVRMGRV